MDWRDDARSFTGLAAGTTSQTILTGSGEPERLSQARVSANTMNVLGLRPIKGRAFITGEDEVSAPRVAMLSEGLWQRRFGRDPNIVGRKILLDEFPTLIIGIAPSTMSWPEPVDVWLTTRFTARDLSQSARGARWITVVGRLAPNSSLAQARAEMDAIGHRIERLDPVHNTNVGITTTPLLADIIGDVQKPLFVLLGAVAFVLLIACANVGGLMLGRLAARDGELAVRTALGASRGRIARQILTESFLIAALGGLLGILLAVVGVKALVALAPAELPRLDAIRLDAPVLAFTFVVTTLTALLFGAVPARQGSTTDLHGRLRSAGRSALGSAASARARRLLVVAEIALAIVLLTGAGLLLRSFAQIRQVDPGFRPEGVSTFAIALPATRYATSQSQLQFTTQLLDGIRHAPGVSAAAASFNLPLSGARFGFTFVVRGRAPADPRNEPRAQARVASAEYFAAMGIPLVRGRAFTNADRADAPQALVISAEVARRYFPNEDPIGKYIETGWVHESRKFGGEVIGIVGDVRQDALDRGLTPHIYMSYDQWPLDEYDVVVRSTASEGRVLTATRSVLKQLDADVPMNGARSLDDIVMASLGARRFYLMLLAMFAAVAMALALAGIYGVIAYGVQQRRREIGIRLALGASRERVLAMVLKDGLRLAAIGAVLGVLTALPLTRLLNALVFAVGTRDPLTLVAVPSLLIVAAAVACLVPARSASRLDPVEAIRAD
jgi:putative ABC transport system permease protein